MLRYFTYRYKGTRQQFGKSGKLYWFQYGEVTPVEDEIDAEFFLHMGTPENGAYPFRETDVHGNPIGPFPPIDMSLREAMLDIRKFPTAPQEISTQDWVLSTEIMSDPVLYFHYIRKRLRG